MFACRLSLVDSRLQQLLVDGRALRVYLAVGNCKQVVRLSKVDFVDPFCAQPPINLAAKCPLRSSGWQTPQRMTQSILDEFGGRKQLKLKQTGKIIDRLASNPSKVVCHSVSLGLSRQLNRESQRFSSTSVLSSIRNSSKGFACKFGRFYERRRLID